MPPSSPQRAFALDIVRKLRAAGHQALWAGGCVRDEILGIVPKDYDVATSATPDEIRALFGHRRTLAIGAAFGVIAVLGPRAAGQIDVATFRTDATYSDGRRPDRVAFASAPEDAARRDFTINGLFFDPLAGEVIDYVAGRDDLKNRLIRAIGDPHLRFGEDKLRLLRAVRFAAAFDFAIEPATLAAIERMAAEVTTVSAERIGMEIRRMLVDDHRAIAVQLLCETGVLTHVLPEVAALGAAAFEETQRALATLRAPTLPLALAALLHGVMGESARFDSAPLAHDVARRLRYTNKEADRTAWILARLPQMEKARQIPWPELQRILIHEGAEELLALREAIAGPNDVALAFCRERRAWPADQLNPPPLVTGSDLVAHGIRPGPDFSKLLERARDAQLLGEIHTSGEALALVDRLQKS